MREGLLPHKVTTLVRLDTDEASARAATELIGELLDPEETAVSAFEDEASGAWRLEIYFASEPDEAAIRALLGEAVGARGAEAAVFEPLNSRDWVASSLEGLRPVEAGRFIVHGAHDRAEAARRTNRIAIEIEAALAFGTGHHGTTRGCLIAIEAAARRRRPARALDVGTGTGVLAIALARLLRRPVAATDIDPVAVEVARENARLNGAGGLVRPVVAPGLRHPAIRAGRAYDLVVANILARPLIRLAPALAGALRPGGVLILSGLQGRDVPGVLAAARAQGLALASRGDIEGWATLVLKRGGAAPRRPASSRRL